MTDALKQLDTVLSKYLVAKAPKLPKDITKLLVALAPWFAVLGAVFGLPAILAAFGLSLFVTPLAWIAGARTGIYWLFWLIGLIQVVLAALAIKPLFARALHGWQLLFYSQLLSLLPGLWHFSLGSLLVTTLSFYLLYQIKASYK